MSRKRDLRHFAFVAAPKLVQGASLLGLNILLIDAFDPPTYGAYSLCVVAIIVVDAVIGAPIDIGVLSLAPIYRRDDAPRSDSIEAAAVWLKLSFLLCLGVVVAGFGGELALLLTGRSDLTNLIAIAYAAFVAMLMLRSCLVHLQIDQQFLRYGLVDWVHVIAKYGSIALCMALMEASPQAALSGFAIGPAVAFLVGVGAFAKDRSWLTRFRLDSALELWRHVRWLVPVAAVGGIRDRMDLYFLALWSTPVQVGVFSAARAIALIPELLGMYLGVVFSPRIMPLHREGRLYEPFRKIQLALMLSALAILGVAVAALDLAGGFVPHIYEASISVFAILLLGAMTALISHPVVAPFVMFTHPKFAFNLDLVAMPVMIAAYGYAIPAAGALGAAWVTTGARLAVTLILHAAAWGWARNGGRAGQLVSTGARGSIAPD